MRQHHRGNRRGPRGELIFRWIYSYLGYTKPFRRLWISSLTDEAIREGMANLRGGKRIRQPLCRRRQPCEGRLAGGHEREPRHGDSLRIGEQLHRPCADSHARHDMRTLQGKPELRLHSILAAAYRAEKDDVHRQFFHPEDFRDKNGAEAAYRRITSDSVVTINKVERKTVFQQAPLLYDLTALQKDCNIHHDLSADKTLSIAQSPVRKETGLLPENGQPLYPGGCHGTCPGLAGKGHHHAPVQGIRTDFRPFRPEHPERGRHESDRPPCTDRHGRRSRRAVRGGSGCL